MHLLTFVLFQVANQVVQANGKVVIPFISVLRFTTVWLMAMQTLKRKQALHLD